MDLTTHLKTFVTVANLNGFSGAARQLDVVPSVVAKRIAQLEEHVGARLFNRTTRTIALTEAGEKLLATCRCGSVACGGGGVAGQQAGGCGGGSGQAGQGQRGSSQGGCAAQGAVKRKARAMPAIGVVCVLGLHADSLGKDVRAWPLAFS